MESVKFDAGQEWDPIEENGDYGNIVFASHTVASKAEFIRVAQVDEAKISERQKAEGQAAPTPIMKYAMNQWFDEPPKLLLRVVGTTPEEPGTALDPVLDAVMDDVFKAASSAQGWVLTCGNEHEVPGLVGHGFDRLRATTNAPLIGVNAWSTVERREQLLRDPRGKPLKGKGVRRTYRDPKPDDILETRPLQPFHTHFVFFGGGTFEKENDEPSTFDSDMIQQRTTRVYAGELTQILENEVLNYMLATGASRGPPRVMVLIGGDELSLTEVVAFHASGGFIVVAQDSGGLAEVLADVLSSLTVPSAWRTQEESLIKLANLEGVKDLRRKSIVPGAAGAAPSLFGQGRIACVTINGNTTTFMAIQQAVMAQLSPIGGTDERICMAVSWGDAERLEAELRYIPIWEERRAEVLARVLQMALDCGEVECVRVALHNGAPAKDVDLCDLYWTKLFNTTNPPQYYLFEGISKPVAEEPQSLTRDGSPTGYVRQEDDGSSVGWELYFPPAVWALLSATVPGLVKFWKNKLKKVKDREAEQALALKAGRMTEVAEMKSKKVGCRVVDLYVWAVLLGNTEMALTMLPYVQEPMRAAIIGASLCIMMADKLPLHKAKLEAAKDQHEDFALELLDLCDSFGDARRMLTTKSRHWNRTVVDLAVQAHLLRFCEHRYCQLLCNEMLRGNMDFGVSAVLDNSLTSKAGLMGASMIVFHGIVPVPWPGILTTVGMRELPRDHSDEQPDSIFALGWVKRQTAFVSDKEREQDKKDGRHEQLTMTKYYEVPLVRQLLRLFSYILFAVLYSYVVIQPNLSEGQTDWKALYALTLWTVALAFDEWHKWASDAATFDFDFWKKYDWSVIALTLASMAVGVFEVGFMYDGLEVVSVFALLRLLKFLQLSQPIGVLIIMIMAMLSDIALWALVSFVFTAAFTVAFVATSQAPGGPLEVAIMPMWALIGDYDVDEVTEWSPKVGQGMIWVFIVVSNILLVNLLIAMMGDTYATIKENSDAEWKIGRLRSVQESVRQMHPVPPPLNLPLTVMHFVQNLGGRDDKVKISDEAQKELNANWAVGGKLWEAKREKDRVARTLLSKLTKKRAEEAADKSREEGIDDRLKNVETMIEGLYDLIKKSNVKTSAMLEPAPLPMPTDNQH